MVRVDYLMFYTKIKMFIFHIQKIEEIGPTSTSVAKGTFNQNNIKFNNIFRAEPPIDSMYHFGSRLTIKEKTSFYNSRRKR